MEITNTWLVGKSPSSTERDIKIHHSAARDKDKKNILDVEL